MASPLVNLNISRAHWRIRRLDNILLIGQNYKIAIASMPTLASLGNRATSTAPRAGLSGLVVGKILTLAGRRKEPYIDSEEFIVD